MLFLVADDRSDVVTRFVQGKRMVKALLVLLAVLLPLSAFGAEAAATARLEGPDTDFAKSLVAELQAGHYDALAQSIDPSLQTSDLRPTLEKMAALLPPEPPDSVEVGTKTVTTFHSITHDRTTRSVAIFLQYAFAGKWVVAEMRWHSVEGGPNIIDSFRLQPLPASLETIHRFTFKDKGPAHYLMLAAMVAAPAFSLAVLFLCLRTPMRWPRKTLWAVAILLGVARFQLNWTDGGFAVEPLNVQILSAGFLRASQLSPWILSVSVPLAAIVFLVRRRRGKFGPVPGNAASAANAGSAA